MRGPRESFCMSEATKVVLGTVAVAGVLVVLIVLSLAL